jgi:hypothetical protein
MQVGVILGNVKYNGPHIFSRYRSDDASQKNHTTEAERSRRFIETARELGADETGEEFNRAFKKIVPLRLGKTAKVKSKGSPKEINKAKE